MVSGAHPFPSKPRKKILTHYRWYRKQETDYTNNRRCCLQTLVQQQERESNFGFSLVLPVLQTEMEHAHSRDSTDLLSFPHVKILSFLPSLRSLEALCSFSFYFSEATNFFWVCIMFSDCFLQLQMQAKRHWQEWIFQT